jgi:hypothetical protein
MKIDRVVELVPLALREFHEAGYEQVYINQLGVRVMQHDPEFMERHQGMSLAISSQFPALVPKALISQGHVFIGHMYERNAIEYLRHIVGDIAFEAKNLPTGKFIHFHRGQTRLIENGF